MVKKYLAFVASSILWLGTQTLTYADPMPTLNTPAAASPSIIPAAPNVDAAAYVLMDVDSGVIIAQKNMDTRREPASLTKLMTLYIVSKAIESGMIQPSDLVTISTAAWKAGGSSMFLKPGQKVAVSDLIQGVIVDSGNDATIALAEYVGGSQDSFVSLMNQHAQLLGMTGSHFMDPSGLPAPDHYSSAHDLATLARTIWVTFPQYHPWYKQPWLTFNGIRQPNRNRLLWRFDGAEGMKTGHTDQAGYCLIGVATRNGQTLLSVVLGAPSDEARTDDSIQLLTYGFRFYQTKLMYPAGTVIANPRVWYGQTSTVAAGVDKDVYVTAPIGALSSLQTTTSINPNITAPVTQGQTLGQIVINMQNNITQTIPVLALTADPKGGTVKAAKDAVAHKLHQWFSGSASQ